MRSATRAGYSVYSIDCFNDIDTQALTIQSYKLNLFSSDCVYKEIVGVIEQIGINKIDGIILGSGFEHRAEVANLLLKKTPTYFNTLSKAGQNCSAEQIFLKLDELQITYPDIAFDKNKIDPYWLIKSICSAGGYDVKINSNNDLIFEHQYFQKYVDGDLISVNFIADESSHLTIGINKFWCCDSDKYDFRYSGAVCHYQLPLELYNQIDKIVAKISKAFQLRGLCGLDFILDSDNKLQLLDINPRPTATMELYDEIEGSLFEAHIKAFCGKPLPTLKFSKDLTGHQIVYSERDMVFPQNFQWPSWTTCRPEPGTLIYKDEPICIVLDESSDTTNITAGLKRREQHILRALK